MKRNVSVRLSKPLIYLRFQSLHRIFTGDFWVVLHRICTSIFEPVETIQILGDDLVMVGGDSDGESGLHIFFTCENRGEGRLNFKVSGKRFECADLNLMLIQMNGTLQTHRRIRLSDG